MERSSQEPNKIADFYGQKGCRNKERVEHLIFPWGPERVCQADHLTSAVRKFQIYWFKITFLGKVETAVRWDIKSWLADMGLSTSDSIMGLMSLSFFLNCVYLIYSDVPYSCISAFPEAPPPWAWQALSLLRLSCLVTFPWNLSLNTSRSCRPPLWFGFTSALSILH